MADARCRRRAASLRRALIYVSGGIRARELQSHIGTRRQRQHRHCRKDRAIDRFQKLIFLKAACTSFQRDRPLSHDRQACTAATEESLACTHRLDACHAILVPAGSTCYSAHGAVRQWRLSPAVTMAPAASMVSMARCPSPGSTSTAAMPSRMTLTPNPRRRASRTVCRNE